jgi:anaerobic selenocysteine-containing dehydrogenase
VTIAPDFSPSAIHADYHVPVRIGTDAALGLSMCKVIVDAGIYQKKFVQEQTDLPLLIRKDTSRFLRGNEISEGDREDQFFWMDAKSQVLTPAPRGTLALSDVDPALEGSWTVALKDGTKVEVEPAFTRLRRRLADYEPEKIGPLCEIHPDVIRSLARKVATKKTKIFIGGTPASTTTETCTSGAWRAAGTDGQLGQAGHGHASGDLGLDLWQLHARQGAWARRGANT